MSKKESVSAASENSWSITSLLQSSYDRWKNKFLSYFLANICIGAIWIGITVGLIVIGSLISLIGIVFLKSYFIAMIIFGLGIATFFLITIYLFSLLTLVNVKIFVGDKTSIIHTIKSAQPFVWGYIWVGIISAFFLIGLFPFGLMTLFIIPLLWSFWSSFTTFVYVEGKEKGLKNLWISREMYNQKFTLLLVRSLIPFSIGLLISIPHFIAILFVDKQSLEYNFIYILSYILNFLYGGYVLCFNYELYKKLDYSKSAKAPKIWIGLSIFGWIINIFLLFALSFAFIQILPILRQYAPIQQYEHPAKNKNPASDPAALYYHTIINQPLQTSDRTFTLTSVQRNVLSDAHEELSSNEQFLATNISIQNTGLGTITYSPYDFLLQNSAGKLQGPAFSFRLSDAYMLGSGKIASGAKKTGTIVFKVNKSGGPFTLLYKPFTSMQKFTVEVKL